MAYAAPDEHTGLAILAILGILAYPVAILTWAPGMGEERVTFSKMGTS